MTREPLIHIHILRTGGTTLRYSLEKYYEYPVAMNHTVEQLKSIDANNYMVVQGHFCYGIHKVLEIPPRYFTFLRHPVSRVLSVMYSGNPNATEHDIWGNIENGNLFRVVHPSVTQLAGVDNFDEWTNTLPTQELLEVAQSNLEGFEFVGFTECFDKSMAKLCHKADWCIPELVSMNRSKRPVPMPEKSSNLYRTIVQHYSHGMELYEWAKDKFFSLVLGIGLWHLLNMSLLEVA